MMPISSFQPQKMFPTAAPPNDQGWEQLQAQLDPLIVQAVPDPALWQKLDPQLVTWFLHTVAPFPWFNTLALVGLIYMRSGVVNPLPRLTNCHSFLRWAIPDRYPDLAALKPAEALEAYYGTPPRPRGAQAYRTYSTLYRHLWAYLKNLSEPMRTALQPYLLPPLVPTPRLRKLRPLVDTQTRQARKQQAFAVAHQLPELVALGRRRYRWLAALEAQVQAVAQAVQAGTATLPVLISQMDLNGAREVQFRVWDRFSWQVAHQGAPTRRAVKAVKRHPAPPFHSGLFLQLVGDLPEHPWFLRAIAQGVIQGPFKLSSTAQAYLQTLQAPNFSFNETSGLLKPTRLMAWILHFARTQATGTPEDSGLLFCVEPLLAAASVAHFILVSLASTGMRIGELQQVSLDHTCMEYSQLPQFDDRMQSWVAGSQRLYWKLYPKGASERVPYLVTAQMVEAMFSLLELHKRYYGPDSLQPVSPGRLSHFHHAHRFAGPRKFVLQWGGQHIGSTTLVKCLAFLLLEHGCRNDAGQPVHITHHLLRHGVAGWLRQHGLPLEDIMALLKQVNLAITDYYSQPSPQDLYQKIGPALTALADLAETDPTTIRSVGEIQTLAENALKRYGVLRQTPGGTCAIFTPCEVQFKCASCPAYIPDPARRQEVVEKIACHHQAVQLFTEGGDYLQADVQKAYLRDWQRVAKEMEALTQIDLLAPASETILPLIIDDLGDQLRESLEQLPKLLAGGPQPYG